MNIVHLEHIHEVKIGQIEWSAELAGKSSEQEASRFINESGFALADRWRKVARGFGEIIDILGTVTPYGDSKKSKPVVIDHHESGINTHAEVTAREHRKYGYNSIETKFFAITEEKEHFMRAEVFSPPTEGLHSRSDTIMDRFEFLSDEYDWVRKGEPLQKTTQLFLKSRELLLPKILIGEDTQNLIHIALRDPQLNPRIAPELLKRDAK